MHRFLIASILFGVVLISSSTSAGEHGSAYRFDRSPDALVIDYYVMSTWLLPPEPMKRIQIYGDGKTLVHVRTGDLAGSYESTIEEAELQELLAYLETNHLLTASNESLEQGMRQAGHRGAMADGGIYHLRLFLDGTPAEPNTKVRRDIRMRNLPQWAEKYPEVSELQGISRCITRLRAYLELVARKGSNP